MLSGGGWGSNRSTDGTIFAPSFPVVDNGYRRADGGTNEGCACHCPPEECVYVDKEDCQALDPRVEGFLQLILEVRRARREIRLAKTGT